MDLTAGAEWSEPASMRFLLAERCRMVEESRDTASIPVVAATGRISGVKECVF
jgi:hypothetical protein